MDWPAVAAHLARHGLELLPGPNPRFPGGLANQNYLVQLATGPAVLRRPPPGPLPPGAHDMAREHRILSRLPDALGFVPRSLYLCEDLSVIGVPFQILQYREGIVIRATVPPELTGRTGELSEIMLQTLAAIHGVDPAALGLGDHWAFLGMVEGPDPPA
jgi:aminoglycoside phosphotransferase (APT) family kinase protein